MISPMAIDTLVELRDRIDQALVLLEPLRPVLEAWDERNEAFRITLVSEANIWLSKEKRIFGFPKNRLAAYLAARHVANGRKKLQGIPPDSN